MCDEKACNNKHNVSKFFLSSCQVSEPPSPSDVKSVLSQEECNRLLETGVDEIPKEFLKVSKSETAGDINVTVATIKLENSQEKSFIRIKNLDEVKVFALEELLQEDTQIALSTLGRQLAIGLSWRLGNTIQASFYTFFESGVFSPNDLEDRTDNKDDIISKNKLSIVNANDVKIYKGKAPVLFRIENSDELLYSIIRYTDDNSESSPSIKFYKTQCVPGSWELGIISEQYPILNDIEIKPFDESIPSFIEQNIELLKKKPWTAMLPDRYNCLASANGDLNNDGIDDFAVVIEQMPGTITGSRILYVALSQNDGSFKVRWENNDIMGRNEGGVFGDPFSGIDISDKTLSISHYGGSSDRWGETNSYVIENGELILSKAEELEESTFTACGVKTIYIPKTGVIEKRSTTYKGDKLNNLILFSDSTKPGQIFKINDHFYDIMSLERKNTDYPKLPSLYRIPYGERVWDNANLTASQALDLVKKKKYPKLKEVAMRYYKEIIDNYSVILTYEVPDYTYVGGNVSLLYDGQSEAGDEVLNHRIRVVDLETTESEVLIVDDATGEVSIKLKKW